MERGGSSKNRVTRSGKEKAKKKSGGENQRWKRDRGDESHIMPTASVTRIMRRVLPEQAKVTDDAKEAIQRCVSEFISFITRQANDRCHRDYRSTITPNDLVAAMAALGFTDYVQPLTVFLDKHRAHDPSRAAAAPPVARPPPPSQMDLFPQAATAAAYVPSPPAAVDGGDCFDEELPQMRDYFLDSRGGGDGSEFDPFD